MFLGIGLTRPPARADKSANPSNFYLKKGGIREDTALCRILACSATLPPTPRPHRLPSPAAFRPVSRSSAAGLVRLSRRHPPKKNSRRFAAGSPPSHHTSRSRSTAVPPYTSLDTPLTKNTRPGSSPKLNRRPRSDIPGASITFSSSSSFGSWHMS